MEVPPSHAKMVWKVHHKNWTFLMTKGIRKCYTLNCSHKCPCTFPHSYVLLRHLVFMKNHFMWNKEHFLTKCQQLFEFKWFCMETRFSNILKTTNATKFIKTILESTYKVVLGTYKLTAPTRLVHLLRAVEF